MKTNEAISSIWNRKRRYRQERPIATKIKFIIKTMRLNENTKAVVGVIGLLLALPIITGILLLILLN